MRRKNNKNSHKVAKICQKCHKINYEAVHSYILKLNLSAKIDEFDSEKSKVNKYFSSTHVILNV